MILPPCYILLDRARKIFFDKGSLSSDNIVAKMTQFNDMHGDEQAIQPIDCWPSAQKPVYKQSVIQCADASLNQGMHRAKKLAPNTSKHLQASYPHTRIPRINISFSIIDEMYWLVAEDTDVLEWRPCGRGSTLLPPRGFSSLFPFLLFSIASISVFSIFPLLSR